MKVAMVVHDEVSDDPSYSAADRDRVCLKVFNEYRRMHYLDVWHIMLCRHKDKDEPDYKIQMNAMQIATNTDMRAKENAPVFDARFSSAVVPH